ncbi:MAG: glycosyltransferase family 39 protein [Phycisphaeraceae bacterium]|nr:glycosyltransferase family 39 protein [Phycisphaeraceae bacterium]
MKTSTCMPKVSIVVPTLNESGNIDSLISQIFTHLQDQISFEIIVVDDGSTDGTREKVRVWETTHPVHLLARENQRDLATAVTDGAKQGRGDVVVVIDADLSHPPSKILDLALPICQGTHDVAIGSRYIRGGSTTGWPWYRQVLSRGATLLAWSIADAHDPMSGFFAVKRQRLVDLGNDAAGYKIGLEILARSQSELRVLEVPIVFAQREAGESKLQASTVFKYLQRLMVLTGGSISPLILKRFFILTLISMVLDLLLFASLRHQGLELDASHIISFFVTTISAYFLHTRWTLPANKVCTATTRLGQLIGFIILSSLALFPRGGLLGNLIEHGRWPELLAMVPTMIASNMILLGVYSFLQFPQPTLQINNWLRWRIATIGGVAYVLAIKLFYMGIIDLIPEEAYYWNYAKHLDIGYLDHPPMVAWLIALGTWLLGNTELGVRSGAMCCWLVTLVFVYKLTIDLFDKSTAMRAVLLTAVLPFYFFTGFMMTPDAPLTACWAGSLYFLQQALLRDKRKAWYGVGIFLGLGLLSKYTIALLGPAALLAMLLIPQARKQYRWIEPYLAAIIAIAIFSPVLIWNAQHQWASFIFQGPQRLAEAPSFSLHILIGSIALLLTPIGLLGVFTAWFARRKLEPQGTWPDKTRLFTAVFTLVPLSVFVLFSLQHEPKPNWTGPLWLAMLPLMSWSMTCLKFPAHNDHGFSRVLYKLWQPTFLVTLMVLGAFMHYMVLGLPGLGYNTKMRLLVAWEEMGKLVEAAVQQVEKETHSKPLVVGIDKYFTASELAFYRHKSHQSATHFQDINTAIKQTTTDHLMGGTGLMYRYWFPINEQVGKTMLLVSRSENNLDTGRMSSYFESLGPVKEVHIHKHKQYVGCFYYRVGYRFHEPVETAVTPTQ